MVFDDGEILTRWIDLLIDVLAMSQLCPEGDSRENR